MATKTGNTDNSKTEGLTRRSDFQNPMTELFGDVIYTYSRSQAIEDGLLVDITITAREAGFTCPVAITRAAWGDCVEWNEADSKRQTHQDQEGRLWDVVWMASQAARRGGMETLFRFYRVPRGGRGVRPRLSALKMLACPGDDGELVITILMVGED